MKTQDKHTFSWSPKRSSNTLKPSIAPSLQQWARGIVMFMLVLTGLWFAPSHAQAQSCSYASNPAPDINCIKQDPSKPYCMNYKCVECPQQNPGTTHTQACLNAYGVQRPYCSGFKCVECPKQARSPYVKCSNVVGGQNNECADYKCIECNNASKTAALSTKCQGLNPNKPYCRHYKCVECPKTSSASTVCQNKNSVRPLCSANNTCVECLGEGVSSTCQAKAGNKKYCYKGSCRECPTQHIKQNEDTCRNLYGLNRSTCSNYKCVVCPNESVEGKYDSDHCNDKNLSTPFFQRKRYCAQNICVQCPTQTKTHSSACPGDKPVCKNYKCFQCIENVDCPLGQSCQNGQCKKPTQSCGNCLDDDWCQSNADKCGTGKFRCNPKNNTCVRCLVDTDCPNGKTCDPSNNTCISSNCPSYCTTNADCSASDCGTRTSCIKNKCKQGGGGSTCAQPNIIMMTDQSCSMRFGGGALVNTRQPCSSRSNCTTFFNNMQPSYSPAYGSKMQCKRASGSSQNTCHATRWDVAMSGLRQIIADYGGTAPLYNDRRIRWAKMFFSSNSYLPGNKNNKANWGGISDTPNTKYILDMMDSRTAGGGTRYIPAFTMIENHLKEVLPPDPIQGRATAVIFTTDGDSGDSCNTTEGIVDRIYNMKDNTGKVRKIKSYIVGFGSGLSSRGRQCLSRLAVRGRSQPKQCSSGSCLAYFAADSAADLSNALQEIVNEATQEKCDGLDNDCDGLVDNNTIDACNCVMSFARPVPTSSIYGNSPEYRAGVRLYTFIASFDLQSTCPGAGTDAEKNLKAWQEACKNKADKAVSCSPGKPNAVYPAGDAYTFYKKRCEGSGYGSCTWPNRHACKVRPWLKTSHKTFEAFCKAVKRTAIECRMPRGILMRSGTGYDTNGKLTVLAVKDFGADVLNKQSRRFIFVHMPKCDYRIKKDPNTRPLIADVTPNNYENPSITGLSYNVPTWSSTGSGCSAKHHFTESNTSIQSKYLGIKTQSTYCNTNNCEHDRRETIWYILGYKEGGATTRTNRLGAIYHSTPVILPPVKVTIPDPGHQLFTQQKIPAGSGSFGNRTTRTRPSVLYVGTGDGIMHAFNVNSGVELWGYIPRYFLEQGERASAANLPSQNTSVSQRVNDGDTLREAINGVKTDNTRAHLVDGSPLVQDVQMYRYVDSGASTCPNGSSGPVCSQWRSVLVFGLRAGGRAYTAIDVTNPYKPRLLWEISHKSALDPHDSSKNGQTFDQLGLTYGQAYIGNVLINFEDPSGNVRLQERAIAFLPGGIKLKKPQFKWEVDYNSPLGSVVYAVDLESGRHVATIDATDLDLPGSERIPKHKARGIAAAPIGYNVSPSLTTRIFFGDIQGRIFRVDLSDPDPRKWKSKLFYNLYVREGGFKPIMTQPALAINKLGQLVLYGGTGNIQDLDQETEYSNKIYSLREVPIQGSPGKYRAIPNYVFVLNKQLAGEPKEEIAKTGPQTSLNNSPYGKSQTGERLTGPPVIFAGTAYFTTYTPKGTLPICGVKGYSRFYGLHFNNACSSERCRGLNNANSGNPVAHPYLTLRGYAESSGKRRTPFLYCLDGISSTTSVADNQLLGNRTKSNFQKGRCMLDLNATIPMLTTADTSNNSAGPFEYVRYHGLGPNTLAMGAVFSYQPGEINYESMRNSQNGKFEGHNYKQTQKGRQFVTFQIAGNNPAASDTWRLNSLRAVKRPVQSLEKGAVATASLADAPSAVRVHSWGLVLD